MRADSRPNFDDGTALLYLFQMAEGFGKVKSHVRGGGRTGKRHHIYCGTVLIDGESHAKVRIWGHPAIGDPSRIIQFESAEDAELELRRIRAQIVASGSTLGVGEIIKPYIPAFRQQQTVGMNIKKYVAEQQRRAEAGQLSAGGAIKDLARWSRPDGHWSFFFNHPIDGIKRTHIKDWHQWLADRGLGDKTRSNVSKAFRTFLRSWAKDHERPEIVPDFPSIATVEHAPKTITMDRVLRILEAIPWESRGLFLAIAFESLRFSEASAHLLEDWDGTELHLHRGRQGQSLDSRISHGKTRANIRREPWSPQMREWLEWRASQTTSEQRLAGEATALFWHPAAANREKFFNYTSSRRIWNKACAACGEKIAMQEGLRHSTLSALAEVLPDTTLRAHSRHADGGSLHRYTKGARPNADAMVKILKQEK